jgi:hypothetical protein
MLEEQNANIMTDVKVGLPSCPPLLTSQPTQGRDWCWGCECSACRRRTTASSAPRGLRTNSLPRGSPHRCTHITLDSAPCYCFLASSLTPSPPFNCTRIHRRPSCRYRPRGKSRRLLAARVLQRRPTQTPPPPTATMQAGTMVAGTGPQRPRCRRCGTGGRCWQRGTPHSVRIDARWRS